MAAGTPVDKEAFPHYHELIREPMDFSTVGLRLERGHYRSAHAFAQDVRLTLLNCLAFETEGTPVVKLAQRCAYPYHPTSTCFVRDRRLLGYI